MKFKKFLAVMLSAAMMVTSVNLAGLGDVTVVSADVADSSFYDLTVTNGTKTISTISSAGVYTAAADVEYGETITLAADVARKESATDIQDGQVAYSWSVDTGKTDEKTKQPIILTGNEANFSFKAEKDAGDTYTVNLTTTKMYNKIGNEKVNAETDTATITVTVGQKALKTTDVADPGLNKVYMPNTGSPKISDLTTINPYLFQEDTVYKGTWAVKSGQDSALKVGENEVEVTYTIGGNYKGAYVNADNKNGWDSATQLTRKIKVTVLDKATRVTEISGIDFTNGVTEGTDFKSKDLIYIPGAATDNGLGEGTALISYTVDALNVTESEAKKGDYFDFTYDSKLLNVSYNPQTRALTVKAVSADAKTADLIITDKAGTGIVKKITFPIIKGVVTNDFGFTDELSGAVKTVSGDAVTYTYTLNAEDTSNTVAENTIATLFPKFTPADAAAGKTTYAASIGTTGITAKNITANAINKSDEVKLTKTYTLGTNEKFVDLEGTSYTLNTVANTNGCITDTISTVAANDTTKAARLVIKEHTVTKDEVLAALKTIKAGDVVLYDGTVPFGTDLTDKMESTGDKWLPAASNWLDVQLYKKGDTPTLVNKGDATASTVGANTSYFLRISTGSGDYDLSKVDQDYPLTFTVTAKKLGAKLSAASADFDDFSNSKSDVARQANIKSETTLTAVADTYEELATLDAENRKKGTDYTYSYQWYKNGEAIDKATGYQYTIAADAKGESDASGVYTCTITAKAVAGKSGKLDESALTATTPALTITDSAITAYAFKTVSGVKIAFGPADGNGVGSDLGAAADDSKFVASNDVVKGIHLDNIEVPGFVVLAPSGYTLSKATLNVVGTKTKVAATYDAPADPDSTQFRYIKYINNELAPDTYILTVTAEAVSADGKITQKYSGVIGKYTLTAYDPTTQLGKADNYAAVDGKNTMEYGTKLADSGIAYKFALSKANKDTLKASTAAGYNYSVGSGHVVTNQAVGYTDAELTALENLINAEYSFSIAFPKDGGKDVVEPVPVTAGRAVNVVSNHTGTDARLATADGKAVTTTTATVAKGVKVTKKKVQLTFGADELTWIIGEPHPVASYPNGVDGKKIVGFGDNVIYTYYRNVDKDGNGINKVAEDSLNTGDYYIQASEIVTVQNYESVASVCVPIKRAVQLTAISAQDMTVELNKTATIEVTTVPNGSAISSTTQKLNYKVEDESILTVDAEGVITAKAEGATKVTITLTDKEGNSIDGIDPVTITVTVSKIVLPTDLEEYRKEVEANEKTSADLEQAKKDLEAANADKAAAETAKKEAEEKAAASDTAKAEAEKAVAAAETAKKEAEEKAAASDTAKAEAEKAVAAAETAKKTAETNLAAANAKVTAAEKKVAEATAALKKAKAEAATVKKGDQVVVSKNIYKVTNVAKKTVTFVGTVSTGKTVKIAKTIKINKVAYKVTEIAANTMKNNKNVKKIVVGENVAKIGKNAFNGCENLKNVQINSKKVKTVGKNAFKSIVKKATIKTKSAAIKKLVTKSGVAKTVTVK